VFFFCFQETREKVHPVSVYKLLLFARREGLRERTEYVPQLRNWENHS